MTLALGLSGGSVLRRYELSMRRNPLGTKMATCAVGFAAGDIVAQVLAHQKTPNLPGLPQRTFLQAFDYGRAARMSLFGGLIAAPQMHVFFNWLDRVVMPMSPKHPVAILSKVVIDQFVNSPIGTMTFLAWTQSFKGCPQNTGAEIADKLWPTTQASWRLWPAAQVFNFVMVPAHLRIVFINVVAILWTSILSRMGN